MPFWGGGLGRQKNDVLDGGSRSVKERGIFLGEMVRRNVTYRENAAAACQKWLNRSICHWDGE